ncbi:hypothetical protein GCM10009753_53890 [Streptantibioticus ferralitis]
MPSIVIPGMLPSPAGAPPEGFGPGRRPGATGPTDLPTRNDAAKAIPRAMAKPSRASSGRVVGRPAPASGAALRDGEYVALTFR